MLLFVVASLFAKADVIDDIAGHLKSGDIKALSAYFSSTVELSVLGQEDIYSNVQAGIILKDFFQKNPPKSYKVIHKVTSNVNYKLGVILLTTSNDSFRVSYELKSTEGKFQIAQMRIEENKE